MDTMTPGQVFEMLEDEGDENALKMDGFDDCIVGLASVAGNNILVYDQDKILERLMQEMEYDEALEHFSFNIDCAHLGPGTPAIMYIKINAD